MTDPNRSSSGEIPVEATQDEIRDVFDNVNFFYIAHEVPATGVALDLVPPEGYLRFAINRRHDVQGWASVIRRKPRVDLGPEAHESEVFQLRLRDDGTRSIKRYTDIVISEEDLHTTFYIDDEGLSEDEVEDVKAQMRGQVLATFFSKMDAQDDLGETSVSGDVCRELVEQVVSGSPL
jgi:hypothetical protein